MTSGTKVRRKRTPPLARIMRDALHRATRAGYDRRQIATAFVHMAEPLSGSSYDPYRALIADACRLQERLIQEGFDAASLRQLAIERASLASPTA